MASDQHISDLLKHGRVVSTDETIGTSSPDNSDAALVGDPQALMRLARTATEKGMESGVNTQGIAVSPSGTEGKTGNEKSSRRLDDFIFLQTLELARQMAVIDARMATLSQRMDEVAVQYLSEDEMQRTQGETEEQYRARQYQLMKARHEQGLVSDEGFSSYEENYREWLKVNEQKRELQKELDKPEHQANLRELSARQQHLETRRQDITQRSSSLAGLLEDLKGLKALPVHSDTEMDIALMRLLASQPEIAKQLDTSLNAPLMTTDEKIEALELIAKKVQSEALTEAGNIQRELAGAVDFEQLDRLYTEEADINTDNAAVQMVTASNDPHYTGLKL